MHSFPLISPSPPFLNPFPFILSLSSFSFLFSSRSHCPNCLSSPYSLIFPLSSFPFFLYCSSSFLSSLLCLLFPFFSFFPSISLPSNSLSFLSLAFWLHMSFTFASIPLPFLLFSLAFLSHPNPPFPFPVYLCQAKISSWMIS